MNFARAALRRPLTVLVAVLAVALGSLLAGKRMARDIFPPLDLPTIYVAQSYGGMDPAQMEGYLVYFFEYHFLYLTGIEHVESKSIQGAALMKLQFHPGTDMSQAMAETVAYVNRARAFMPPGTVPPFITRLDEGGAPVGQLVFSSETRSVTELQDLALNRVRPLFATLSGVSAPPPFGGNARSIVVNLKPERLQSYHLSPDEVVQAIAAANLVSPSGNILRDGKYPMVPLNSVAANIKELEAVPVRTGEFPAVFVRDVGKVEHGSDIVTSYALVNGRRTVYVPVTKRADASTLAVADLVKANLPKFQAVLPADVTVSYEMDQSPHVRRALAGLPLEGALGAVLTGLMVLLFLRDWRSALVVVVNIPLSLMAALLALCLSGQTINIMTLGGLVLAVGILVDEATVCLENIHVHRARGSSLAVAALDATTETTGPRLLAMLCIVAMFIPVLFMTGAAWAMFLPLSLAVGFAMVASYVLSSTLVPIMAIQFLGQRGRVVATGRFTKFQTAYAGLLQCALRVRWLLVLSYFALAAAVIALVGGRLGTSIFPRVEGDQLQVRLRAPAGTDIDGTEKVALQTLQIIKRVVGVENVEISLGLVGVHGASYPINFLYLWNGGTEEGVLQVRLRLGASVRGEELKERLRREFATLLPAVNFCFEPSDIVSRVMSLNVAMPIEVAVSGPRLDANRAFAEKVKAKLEALPALRDVQFSQSPDYPTVEVAVDRERAGIIGADMAQVSRALVPATSSSRFTVPNFWADPGSGVAYQVQVQIPQQRMDSLEAVGNLPVTEAHGEAVLLRNLARISEGTAMSQHDRYNMQRLIGVRANVAGEDLGGAAREVAQAIKELGAPPERVSVTLRGQVIPMLDMQAGLRRGVGVAVVSILLLLTAYFQSAKLSCIVVSTVPAVLAGVVVALWATGTTWNLQSFMGAIMAVGVAVANAILLVTFAERSRLNGASAWVAAVEGARSRLRAILMTSAAMIAGMLPMAFGFGEAGGQTAPLGRAVVGGLIGATLATLVVLPAVFALVQARSHRRSSALDVSEEQTSGIQLQQT